MEHEFTKRIREVLVKNFGGLAEKLLSDSQIIQYLNIKTKSASKGSKSRGSFANLYAIYVLVEDYISKDFHKTGKYAEYEGAVYTDLFKRQRELPFGKKLQNHALNNRMNMDSIMEVLERYLPEKGLILDLGCGYGITSYLVSATHPERNVVGVDMSSHRILVANSNNQYRANLKFYDEDIRYFQFSQYDAIIIIDTLYLLSYKAQEAVLKRCHEQLCNDSVLIIKDNSKSRSWKYFYAYAEEKLKTMIGFYGWKKKQLLYYWRVKDFTELMNNIGFKVTTIPLKSILPYQGVFYICHKQVNCQN
jgi:2-polyprenyl-3-methyl-5-hydroxy-6-metoxy-1,4-benzoquinol methylase